MRTAITWAAHASCRTAARTSWDLMERAKVNFAKPKRDVVATDDQKLTLGDTTVTMHFTPGHTLGTISMVIPVKDGNAQHMAAYWGGTAFNWVRGPANYITPNGPRSTGSISMRSRPRSS